MTAPDDALPPSLDDFARIAEAAFAELPADFRALCGDVEIHVADWPPDELLDDLEIADAYDLTGVYQGHDLSRRTVLGPAPEPSRVVLFRRPILDEWADHGGVTLSELIGHVLVHEIGHHFGLSDEAMHRVEEEG